MKDEEKRDQTVELSLSEMLQKELGFGEDLIIDEDDRNRLERLPQIKKEEILEERRARREQMIQRYEFVRSKKNQVVGKNLSHINSSKAKIDAKMRDQSISSSSDSSSSDSSSSSGGESSSGVSSASDANRFSSNRQRN